MAITFTNPGSKAVTLNVVDRIGQGSTVKWAITLAGKETRTIAIPTTQDWYDLGITLVGESYFYQSRWATSEGRDGVSKPSLLRWS